jgi:hypothetical protein
VIAYATGMGAVEPPVATAQAAPQQALSPLILYPGESEGDTVCFARGWTSTGARVKVIPLRVHGPGVQTGRLQCGDCRKCLWDRPKCQPTLAKRSMRAG